MLFGATVMLVTRFGAANGLEPFQQVGFLALGLVFLFFAFFVRSWEWRFEPQQRQASLREKRIGWKRQRTFDFDDIRAIRRQSWMTEENPPRERFRLLLLVGEADDDLVLSPKDLTLAQADELQEAVQSVVGKPLDWLA